MLFFNNKLAPL